MNEVTKNVLKFDPLAMSEVVTGKRHEEWDEDEQLNALGACMFANDVKKDYLKSIGDTYFGIKWQEFLDLITTYGFIQGYSEDFIDGKGGNTKTEQMVLYYHKEKGLILHAESYSDKTSINSAKVYGELTCAEPTQEQWKALTGFSHGALCEGNVDFNVDGREGLLFHLETVSSSFELNQRWNKIPFLWFLNYTDTRNKGYDYKALTEKRILASTQEIKDIIGY